MLSPKSTPHLLPAPALKVQPPPEPPHQPLRRPTHRLPHFDLTTLIQADGLPGCCRFRMTGFPEASRGLGDAGLAEVGEVFMGGGEVGVLDVDDEGMHGVWGWGAERRCHVGDGGLDGVFEWCSGPRSMDSKLEALGEAGRAGGFALSGECSEELSEECSGSGVCSAARVDISGGFVLLFSGVSVRR